MEFWAVEVKSGEPVMVRPGENNVIHLSQASLGEGGEGKKNKGNESVCLFANVDGKKLVLGTLYPEKLPQQLFDLAFERDFELTHNWKNGSVFFLGYKADNPFDEPGSEDESGSESDEEEIPLAVANNVGPSTQVKQDKPESAKKANAVKDSAAGKQKVKIVEPTKDDEDSSDEDDSMSSDDSDDVEDMDSGSDDEDDDDSDEEEKEETPKKVQSSKKRTQDSATKSSGPDKKAKFVTPQKTDGKKGSGHVATPHPSKQAGKTPANKSNQQTPSSDGAHSCKSCNRTFKSDTALDSHNKAKHTTGK